MTSRTLCAIGAAVASSLAILPMARANITLTDGNSVVNVNTGTSIGLSMWTVDGASVPGQEWYWYRTSPGGAEQSISSLSAPSEFAIGNIGLVSYSAGGLTITVTFTLAGGSAGSGLASVSQAVHFQNLSGMSGYSAFQYGSFDLSNGANDTTTDFLNINTAQQHSNSTGWTIDTSLVPTANHHAAGFQSSLLNSLNDAGPTTLNDSNSSGPGQAEWAFQWDIGGTDFIISKNMTIQVPEPATLGLLAMGALALSRRVRRVG